MMNPQKQGIDMIGKPYFKDQMKMLEQAFNSAYSKEQQQRCYKAVKGYEPQHIKRAVDALVLNQPRLPTLALVMQEVRQQYQNDWQRTKVADKATSKELLDNKNQDKNTPLMRDSINLINQSMSNAIDKYTLYDKMMALEGKYPNIGWKENANVLKNKVLNAIPNHSDRPF
jgi:hypothetical protein